MASYLYYHEDEDFCGKWYAEIEVEYDAWAGEKMVRYDRDGSGYPGSPPGCEITGARVVHLECDKHVYFDDLLSRQAYDAKWLKMLDEKALESVEASDLDDQLLEAADAADGYDQ